MSGELSDEQLRSIFTEDVRPYVESQRLLATGGRSWPPVLVYTGGQPGAGKSRANERVSQLRPSLVPVVGDDLRRFHPDYARLMREDPLGMPAATAQASGQWIGMAAEYLREQRADVLIEATLRSPAAMASTIAAFREAGYVVELRAVAVPGEVSRLSTVERYTGQVAASGAGRWTPAASHDEAFEQAPRTVEELVAAGAVDRFVVEDRAGAILTDMSFFGFRDDVLRGVAREAAEAFDQARGVDKMSTAQAREWLDLAQMQVGRLAALRVRDADLLHTIERVATVDAAAVAGTAFPGDADRRRAVTEKLTDAAARVVRAPRQIERRRASDSAYGGSAPSTGPFMGPQSAGWGGPGLS